LNSYCADLWQTFRHVFRYFACGRYWISGEETASSGYGGLSASFVSLHKIRTRGQIFGQFVLLSLFSYLFKEIKGLA
jgi:hypothetical protein